MNHPPNRALAAELRDRHYILHSAKHPRRWVAFSPKKVGSYRSKFGDKFCLVVTGHPSIPGDFYAFPWSAISELFTEANRFPVQQKNGTLTHRWQIHLEGPEHHFQMEFSPSDPRSRPRFDASQWYGNAAVLGLPPDSATSTLDIADLDDDFSASEGREIFALHRRRERDPALAQRAKQQRLKISGNLSCDVCSFDFVKAYGTLGNGFIEAHHTLPLRELAEETRTKIRDLALVCANCHRMLHRGETWLAVGQLRELVKNPWQAG